MADQEEDQGITAYHGSPHEFEQFDLSKIGTGEGAQSYGHGLYFAEAEPIARQYRDALSQSNPEVAYKGKPLPVYAGAPMDVMGLNPEEYYASMFGDKDDPEFARNAHIEYLEGQKRSIPSRDNLPPSVKQRALEDIDRQIAEIKSFDPSKVEKLKKGHMYEVSINAHPDHFLDWDKPLNQQHPYVDAALQSILKSRDRMPEEWIKSSPGAEKNLLEAGIKGIKYLDAGSRDKKRGTRNYVVFDDKLVNVKRRYAQGGKVEDRPHFGLGGEGEGPDRGSTGSASGASYGSGSSGSMAEGRAADRESVSGYSASGGGGGGRDSSPSINRGGSSGQNFGFDRADTMSPMGLGIQGGVLLGGVTPSGYGRSQSQESMLQAMGIEGPADTSGLPTALRPGGNIGAALTKEVLTPNFSTANSPLASGIESYDQNAINALYDRMREEQQAARDASVARAAIGPVTKQINVPNAGDLYGATDAPLAVNQKPSGMFGQPEFGTTQFGQGPMQSGFPTQSSVPPMTGEEARQGDVPGMSQEALDWNRKMDAMQKQNQSLFSPETNQAVNSATNKFLSAMREMPAKLQEAQPLYAASQIPLIGGMIAKSYGLEQLTPAESAALYNKIYSNQPTLGQNLDWSFGQRAGSMGSMPSGTQQYASDLTPMSSQPARPITPTPSTAMMPTSRQTEAASPAVKQTVRDNFNSAFAAARSQGKATFTWTNPATGQTSLYTTQLARKQGGRVPSFAEPDEWLAEKNESKKPERGAIAKRSGVLSSSKS